MVRDSAVPRVPEVDEVDEVQVEGEVQEEGGAINYVLFASHLVDNHLNHFSFKSYRANLDEYLHLDNKLSLFLDKIFLLLFHMFNSFANSNLFKQADFLPSSCTTYAIYVLDYFFFR